MSEQDRTKQHSANGVGGSNNPAANPGQDKPAKSPAADAIQKQRDDAQPADTEKKGR